MEIKVILVGASGRMGVEISESISKYNSRNLSDKFELIAGIVSDQDPASGSIIPGISSVLGSSFTESMKKADVIIDFSSKAGTELALNFAQENQIPIVIGTTGLNDEDEKKVQNIASKIPILRTRNTSVGVNSMALILEQAAKLLTDDFDVELFEIHHKYKKDSPSGTALMLLESIAKAQGKELNDVLTTGRAGVELNRVKDEIGAQAIRGGDVAGEHTVFFFGEGERIEITHRATKRSIFSDGALKAAAWLVKKKKPMYPAAVTFK